MMIRAMLLLCFHFRGHSVFTLLNPARFLLLLPSDQSAKRSTSAQEMMLSELSDQYFSSRNTFKGWSEPIQFY